MLAIRAWDKCRLRALLSLLGKRADVKQQLLRPRINRRVVSRGRAS